MAQWLIGAVLGVAGGAAGGFAAGLFELMRRRAANRARRRKGEPTTRNEVLRPFWLPGGVAGAAIGAVAIGPGGWGSSALWAFSLPIAVWLSLRALALTLDLIKGGREFGQEFVATVSALVAAGRGPRTIADADLSPQDVPALDADWNSIASFALTFDGYDYWGSFKACGEVANAAAVAFIEHRALPDSLTELRTCLFFEQRRAQHVGVPDSETMEYLRALVEAIREKVVADERFSRVPALDGGGSTLV
jgi:hypothetical protein